MTITLPSPLRMAVALVLIAAVFVAGLRYGRSHRPVAHAAPAPPGPVVVKQAAAATPVSVAAPPATPLVPTLQASGPGITSSRTTAR